MLIFSDPENRNEYVIQTNLSLSLSSVNRVYVIVYETFDVTYTFVHIDINVNINDN